MNYLSITKASITAGLLSLSTQALAHPGHDHSEWTSPIVHAQLLVSAVIVIGCSLWALRYRKHNTTRDESSQTTHSNKES